MLKYKFDKKDFDSEISLLKIGFNDASRTISEQVMGVCFNPEFASEKKYIDVKNALLTIIEKVNKSLQRV